MSFIVYSSFVKSFECLKICMYPPWTCNFSLDPSCGCPEICPINLMIMIVRAYTDHPN
jgi:hypothetical protein